VRLCGSGDGGCRRDTGGREHRRARQGAGFRISERRDDLQFVHVDCGVENLQLGLSAGAAQPPAPGSVALNFSVEGDIEALRARLEARGVRFAGPTHVIPGKVRLASFTDPDGYRLRLAGRP
jgi:catechol 2,3-dioxygenase-like lactoylglutathione lyase family enzyme